MSDDREIWALLAGHAIQPGIRDARAHCVCGWTSDSTLTMAADRREELHRAHVAAVLAAHLLTEGGGEAKQDSLSIRTLQRMRKERDEALARVARLEKQVAFDVQIRLEVEQVLDEAIGTEPVFGAGNGLASDVRLLVAQRDSARASLAARQAGKDEQP